MHKLETACLHLQVFDPLLRKKYTRFANLVDTAYDIFEHLLVYDDETNRSSYTNHEVDQFMKEILEQEADNIKTVKCIDTLMDQVAGKLQIFTALVIGNLMQNTSDYCRAVLKLFLQRTDRISEIFVEAVEDLSYFHREMERLEVRKFFH